MWWLIFIVTLAGLASLRRQTSGVSGSFFVAWTEVGAHTLNVTSAISCTGISDGVKSRKQAGSQPAFLCAPWLWIQCDQPLTFLLTCLPHRDGLRPRTSNLKKPSPPSTAFQVYCRCCKHACFGGLTLLCCAVHENCRFQTAARLNVCIHLTRGGR